MDSAVDRLRQYLSREPTPSRPFVHGQLALIPAGLMGVCTRQPGSPLESNGAATGIVDVQRVGKRLHTGYRTNCPDCGHRTLFFFDDTIKLMRR